jgi:hypothetical protein
MHAMLFRLRPIFRHAYVMHSAISWFHVLEFPNDIQIADRYLVVAICHFNWLYIRKYRTVWYHATSSRFSSKCFHPLSNLGKIDWHASDSACVLSQICSACYVLGVRS